jgi:hypothetical protein
MAVMEVELLVVPGCAHQEAASALLGTALGDIGLGSLGFTLTVIDTLEAAERRHFIGSPTIAVNGEDIFTDPSQPAALACRLYPAGTGTPDLRDLRRALKRAAAEEALR